MRKKKPAVVPADATLVAEDLSGLISRERTAAMQGDRANAERSLAQMAQESLDAFKGYLRDKYELGDRFDVDLATGEARNTEVTVDQVVGTIEEA